MGNILSSLYFYFFITGKDFRIMMVGLDGAGKTTALNRLKLGEFVHTVPTIGFNLEKVKYKGLEFNVWDIGGQEKIRPLWSHYAEDNDAVIFVIDSADKKRLEEAYRELQKLYRIPSLKTVPYLILLNKRDLPDTVHYGEVVDEINKMFDGKLNFYISNCIVKDDNDEGLLIGLDWVYHQIRKRELNFF